MSHEPRAGARIGAALCLVGLGLATLAGAAPTATLPSALQQGELAVARVEPGSEVELHGRRLRIDPEGRFLIAVPRDAPSPLQVRLRTVDGAEQHHAIEVIPRDWPVEAVSGVPPRTVEPPPEIAARIAREQAEVSAARRRDDARSDFAAGFGWPVSGRISGRFGASRSYNGKPGAPHSGMDIAAATGTPVAAPAPGVVSFAAPDLYLTGGTLLIDHGHGLSSVFLHLSRIDVRPGQRVEPGERIGAVGATGRASGPHLHWGINWFDIRLDPLLLPGLPESP